MLVPSPLRDRHVVDRARYFRNPSTRPMAAGKNLTGLRKDGSAFPVEISLSPVRTQNGLLVMSIVRDVTERKEAERRELTMLRALATIGESAAILAHEIKNPVTAVNAALKSVGARLGLADREVLDDLVETDASPRDDDPAHAFVREAARPPQEAVPRQGPPRARRRGLARPSLGKGDLGQAGRLLRPRVRRRPAADARGPRQPGDERGRGDGCGHDHLAGRRRAARRGRADGRGRRPGHAGDDA